MANLVNDLFVSSFLFQTLDKSRERQELGIVGGIVIVGTKVFQKLGNSCFLYGLNVYLTADLPLAARVDMDGAGIKPFVSALEWHLVNDIEADDKHIVSAVMKEEEIPDLCATLITNFEECSDVEWS